MGGMSIGFHRKKAVVQGWIPPLSSGLSVTTLPDPVRIATRFIAAKVWDNPAKIISDYQQALAEFQRTFASSGADPYGGLILFRVLVPLINRGRTLAEWVVQTRSIPSGKAKAVEMAARVFLKVSRVPKNIPDWYTKNQARLVLLSEAAKWVERTTTEETTSEIAAVGPFKVHNTIGATPKQFEAIQGLFESAIRSLNAIKDFRKVLYGDVFVVGQLKQSTTLAWYSVRDDDVYIRSLAKKGIDDLRSLIHELGHRYWFKFLSLDVKQRMARLYSDLRHSRVETPPLKEGDVLPLPVRGVKGPVIVTGLEGLFYRISTGGHVSILEVQKRLRLQATFPTAYAATNYEEFFAECFSFYTLGKLKPDLTERFEAALSL